MLWRLNFPAQCEAITKAGHRCAITASSAFQDMHGRCAGEQLRRGDRACAFHVELFCAQPMPLHQSDFCISWIAFKTSGLDVLSDEILEVAIIEDSSKSKFATTVRPKHIADGPPGVHGIERNELLTSPPFREVFLRMLSFVNAIVENAPEQFESSDEDFTDNADHLLILKVPSPRALLVGHNSMKFDFPVLVSEPLRRDCNVFELESVYYCDTLPALRATSAHMADGCARLQCMARCCNSGGQTCA